MREVAMTGKSFEACAQKMRDNEMSEVAVEQFKRLYDVWQNDEQEWIRESEIEPMDNHPPYWGYPRYYKPQGNRQSPREDGYAQAQRRAWHINGAPGAEIPSPCEAP